MLLIKGQTDNDGTTTRRMDGRAAAAVVERLENRFYTRRVASRCAAVAGSGGCLRAPVRPSAHTADGPSPRARDIRHRAAFISRRRRRLRRRGWRPFNSRCLQGGGAIIKLRKTHRRFREIRRKIADAFRQLCARVLLMRRSSATDTAPRAKALFFFLITTCF